MAKQAGYKGKFTLSTTQVVGVVSFNGTGISNAMLESTELGDTFKTYAYGIGDGGTVEISGLYDPSDTTGQQVIETAAITKDVIDGTDDPRLYYNATDYFELSTDAELLVESYQSIGTVDANNLIPFSCTLRVSGGYFVKHTA